MPGQFLETVREVEFVGEPHAIGDLLIGQAGVIPSLSRDLPRTKHAGLAIASERVEFKSEIKREDQPWYPPRATREALANALCHRDYTIPGGAVAVAMYDDHLEIANPGDLHFGITPEELTIPHESKP